MSDDDKIVSLPVKVKPATEAPLTVVHSLGGCQHRRVQVDEKLAEVECIDCKAKLNPVNVLIMLSREDDRLRDRWAGMRAEIRLLGERTRTKCEHCQKMTRVKIRQGYEEVRAMVDKIKAEESL